MPKPPTTPEPQRVDDDGHPVTEDGQGADTPEHIAAPGDADATPEELAAIDNAALGVEPPEPDPEQVPQYVGYCVNPECQVNSMDLWHPVGQLGVDTAPDVNGRPHACENLDHPHPVMCQCGHLLRPPSDEVAG